ncbi:MAG TPA: carcinine hydrolase/isopenicillin-N N-acyltransferase family protein [Anaerolineaceae bacterium]|jgi:hypothetical protein|nr:carcinine hydrolase/isopenicillin-N N-acyltransferase family protein [Anaerolineaceae bacterium]
MKKSIVLTILGTLMVAAGFIVAVIVVLLNRDRPARTTEPDGRSQKTLDTFVQLDDYPAYVMTYYDDYALDTALANGIRNEKDVLEHFQNLYQRPLAGHAGLNLEHKACTGFTALAENGDAYFGHNEDWKKGEYLVLFTAPASGYASISIGDISYFMDKRDSLLLAPFFPLAGMNSTGLTVSTYSVPECQPPQHQDRIDLIWPVMIRLLLDRAANVAEALQLLNSYDIIIEHGNCMQFFIGDAAGNSVIVDWIDGKTVPLSRVGDWQAVTNFIQQDAQPSEFQNCWRYQAAREFLEDHRQQMNAELGLQLLGKTAQDRAGSGGTQFSVLFNQSRGDVYIVFGRHYETTHYFSLK